MNSKHKLVFIFLLSFFATKTIHSQSVDNGWVAPKEADNLVSPIAGLQPNAEAKQLFIANCSPCHGDKGRGDGPVGASLDPRPCDLTKKRVDNETDGALFWRITNGHQSMPTFKTALSPMQRWQVVSYIRSLEQEAVEQAEAKHKK